MQNIEQAEVTASYVMSPDNIAAYVQSVMDSGASKDSIRVAKQVTKAVFECLPKDKVITKDRLLAWRHLKGSWIYRPNGIN